MKIEFIVPGPPQGKARPRVVRMKNGMSMSYTPDKTVAYEELVRQRFTEAAEAAEWQYTENALCATIIAYFPIPKSVSKKKRDAMVRGEIRPTKKPDRDNIEKIVFDALNEHAYKDDAQIVEGGFAKVYTTGPGKVIVRMQEVK